MAHTEEEIMQFVETWAEFPGDISTEGQVMYVIGHLNAHAMWVTTPENKRKCAAALLKLKNAAKANGWQP